MTFEPPRTKQEQKECLEFWKRFWEGQMLHLPNGEPFEIKEIESVIFEDENGNKVTCSRKS